MKFNEASFTELCQRVRATAQNLTTEWLLGELLLAARRALGDGRADKSYADQCPPLQAYMNELEKLLRFNMDPPFSFVGVINKASPSRPST